MGSLMRPRALSHNVVCVGGCFDVTARQNFAGAVVNMDCIPCNREKLMCVGCDTEVFGVFVFAILFQTPAIRLMFSMACASINVIKRPANTTVCAGNPILSAFCFGIDNHGMYPL